jgi:hypothetical protein
MSLTLLPDCSIPHGTCTTVLKGGEKVQRRRESGILGSAVPSPESAVGQVTIKGDNFTLGPLFGVGEGRLRPISPEQSARSENLLNGFPPLSLRSGDPPFTIFLP